MKPVIVSVTGISGSGKSTVAEKIKERYGKENCVIISSDRYYREQVGKSFEEREKSNYDEPSILEFELLDENLAQLRLGNSVKVPKYNFGEHARCKNDDGSEVREDIHPTKIIIVDGILIFQPSYLQNKFDVPVFVDTPPAIAILLRIARDIAERGRTFFGAMKQCITTVIPGQDEFVLPFKKRKGILVVRNDDIHLNEDNPQAVRLEDISLPMEHVFAAIDRKLAANNTNVHSLFSAANVADAKSESKQEAAEHQAVASMHTIL